MKIVYISGPFRPRQEGNCYEMRQNIRRAEALALEVWRIGGAALCPHLNTANFQGALPDDVWLEGDLEFVKTCDAMIMVEGWEGSEGANIERDFAFKMGVPVFYDLRSLDNWLKEH